jgi:hypothetical protein
MIDVALAIPVQTSWPYGTRLQVYTDFGTGTIDTSQPLLAAPVDPYAGRRRPAGFAQAGYGETSYGGSTRRVGRGGYGGHGHAEVAFGGGQPRVTVVARVRDAYGNWKFAAEAIAPNGDVQTDALEEKQVFLSGRTPQPVKNVAIDSYTAGTLTLTYDS